MLLTVGIDYAQGERLPCREARRTAMRARIVIELVYWVRYLQTPFGERLPCREARRTATRARIFIELVYGVRYLQTL